MEEQGLPAGASKASESDVAELPTAFEAPIQKSTRAPWTRSSSDVTELGASQWKPWAPGAIEQTASSEASTALDDSVGKRAVVQYKLKDFVTVGHKLGTGSFGEVNKVMHKDTSEIFAMKLIPKKKVLDHRMTEYLAREVKTQLYLRHPNILRLHYYFEDKQKVYLLLEYASGGSLFSVLRKRALFSEHEAAPIFKDVAKALAFLHKHGIIHRDLKPENILMCGKRAKLADFGWCAELLQNGAPRHTFCGTWDYLSPEMVQNEPHDFSVDIWALGVLLYEMITGGAPFTAPTQLKAMSRITTVDLQVPDTVSILARDLISRLLVKESSARLSLQDTLHHPWLKQHAPGKHVSNSKTSSSPSGETEAQVCTHSKESGISATDADDGLYSPALVPAGILAAKDSASASASDLQAEANTYLRGDGALSLPLESSPLCASAVLETLDPFSDLIDQTVKQQAFGNAEPLPTSLAHVWEGKKDPEAHPQLDNIPDSNSELWKETLATNKITLDDSSDSLGGSGGSHVEICQSSSSATTAVEPEVPDTVNGLANGSQAADLAGHTSSLVVEHAANMKSVALGGDMHASPPTKDDIPDVAFQIQEGRAKLMEMSPDEPLSQGPRDSNLDSTLPRHKFDVFMRTRQWVRNNIDLEYNVQLGKDLDMTLPDSAMLLDETLRTSKSMSLYGTLLEEEGSAT